MEVHVHQGAVRVRDDGPLLQPGSTCWRIAQAGRIALLIDGAAYFPAMTAALKKARQSILLLGWDFDPRVPLEPDFDGSGRTERLCDLFAHLLAERPSLQIHVLIWDMALPYALQRRDRPQHAGRWLPTERLTYQVDGVHPAGACHHQKVLVVDDSIAFCGGNDFTRNRWDTSEHLPVDDRRRTADDRLYGPRHDVELAVDGAAAAALGDLCRERWRRATGAQLEAVSIPADAWPEDLRPDFVDLPVGISRTEPAVGSRPEVLENETLYIGAIAAARRWIYLESQYFTSSLIGRALAQRLAEADGPEVVVVCPARSGGPTDRLLMDHARNYLIHRLQSADRYGRFRAFAPLAAGDTLISVHSKVMVIDDRLLRVGSANLNNRSLGLDTECDLAIEAEPADVQTRRTIRQMLDRLLGEHLASPRGSLEAAMAQTDSLLASIQALNAPSGRHLRAFDVPRPSVLDILIGNTHALDPMGVADNWRPWRRRRIRPKVGPEGARFHAD
jgi:phosphatidylserine/phosphatidylglycerophosphate/cardiolipin synthase-like enzyme